MRKTAIFFYAVIIAAMAAGYLYFSEEIKSFTFTRMQKFSPSAMSMDKISFIEDDFSLGDYLALIDRIKTAENSAVLFLPQVFNTRTGDYLENINPDEVKKMKEDYRNFTLKLADNQDIIPVVFLERRLSPHPERTRIFRLIHILNQRLDLTVLTSTILQRSVRKRPGTPFPEPDFTRITVSILSGYRFYSGMTETYSQARPWKPYAGITVFQKHG